ncbi:transglutaminase-like domain-containing protein [Paenibacillus sp. OVF10]|nr:transglutaminase-like domain-containing protein [Paenibacillus sp. OVF10]
MLSNRDSATLWLASSGDDKIVKNYSADVMVPVATAEQLRLLEETNKGKDPAAIRRTYLQLPASLPGRVQTLAKEIIQGSETRYDAVQAVKTYLAAHAEYTLDTRMPPRGTDFVDDFLFVTRQGYCNHFSTAMIVLLRSEGIPARWVKGFGSGMADPDVPSQYVISQGDAHSWVEVYFPGAGWMPFEATPGFTMAQGAGEDVSALAGPQPVAENPPNMSGGLANAGAWLLARARPLPRSHGSRQPLWQRPFWAPLLWSACGGYAPRCGSGCCWRGHAAAFQTASGCWVPPLRSGPRSRAGTARGRRV